MLAVSTVYVLVSLRMRATTIVAFALTALGVAYLVSNLERFQRFTTLGDTDMVEQRLTTSLNLSASSPILTDYPIGAGLASSFRDEYSLISSRPWMVCAVRSGWKTNTAGSCWRTESLGSPFG